MQIDFKSDAELREMIAEGFERGVRKVFVMLGEDIDDPDFIIKWHRRRHWVEDQMSGRAETRRSIKDGIMLGICTVTASIGGGAVIDWLKHL
jgi:hypothetical protein